MTNEIVLILVIKDKKRYKRVIKDALHAVRTGAYWNKRCHMNLDPSTLVILAMRLTKPHDCIV